MSFVSCRKRAGFSQEGAARRLGVSPAAVCLWETGGAMPKANRLSAIAALYNCTIDELLKDDVAKPN